MAGATTYNLQRSTTGTGGWTAINGVTSPYTDTGLTTGQIYYYQVDAANGSGTSAWSGSASGTPSAATLFATAYSPTAAQLSLTSVPGTSVAYTSIVQRSTDGVTWPSSAQTTIPSADVVLGSSASSFVDSAVSPGGTYYWQVVHQNNGTTVSTSNVVGPVAMPSAVQPVLAPTSVTVSDVASCSALISWTQPAYSGSNGLEDGFYVERSSDGGTIWRVVVPNLYRGASYFVDNGLEPSTSNYCWRVTAFNGRTQTGTLTATYTNSATSAATSPTVTTSAASGSAPAQPSWQSYTGITVTGPSIAAAMPYSDTVISLEWQLNDTTELGTKVEMAPDVSGSPGTFTELFVVGKWVWHAYITGLVAGTKYWFRVRTFNAGGDSSYTATNVSATTLASGHNYVTDTTGAVAAPRLVFTPQMLAVYRQMAADYAGSTGSVGAQMWANILTYANESVTYLNNGTAPPTNPDVWGDMGQFAALAYVVTGNSQYAAAAYSLLTAGNVYPRYGGWLLYTPVANIPIGGGAANVGNMLHETLALALCVIDWCHAAWTSTEQVDAYAGFENWIEFLAWSNSMILGNLETNINSNLPTYFSTAIWDLLGLDQTAGTWTLQGSQIPYGGLQPSYTSQQPQDLNDPIGATVGAQMVGTFASECAGMWLQYRQGGIGSEGTQYNFTVDHFLILFLDMIRQARGLAADPNEYHPLGRTVSRQNGPAIFAQYTPDLTNLWFWAEDEVTRGIGPSNLLSAPMQSIGQAAGTSRGNAAIGPYVLEGMLTFWNKGGVSPYNKSNDPYFLAYVGVNPYAATGTLSSWPSTPSLPGLPNGWYAPAMGMGFYRDGFGTNNSHFGVMFQPESHADHEHRTFGTFQLYRKGEYAITHPLAYQGIAAEAESANCLLVAGMSPAYGNFHSIWYAPSSPGLYSGYPIGSQGPVACQFGSTFNYSYQCGTTYGPYYPGNTWTYGIKGPVWCHEYTRSIVYLPSTDGHSDAIVTFDRVLAQNPVYVATTGFSFNTPSITNIVAATDGNCQVTISGPLLANGIYPTGGALGVGDVVNISGVTGTTEANGYQIIVALTSQTVFEINVPFVHAYVSGGTIAATGTAGIAYTHGADDNLNNTTPPTDKERVTLNPPTNSPLASNAALPAIPGTAALVTWIVHCATPPTISSNTATWTTVGAPNYSGNSNLTLVSLLPASNNIASYDELNLWNPPLFGGSSGVADNTPTVAYILNGAKSAGSPYAIATGSGTTYSESYQLAVNGATYGGKPYYVGQNTGTYLWYNGSGYTISQALGTNGTAYWTTPAGSFPLGSITANGTASISGTPAILSAGLFQPERRYQIRVSPSSNPWPQDSSEHAYGMLNVLFATDVSGGPTVSASTVQDGTGTIAAGPLVKVSSQNDRLVLFSQVASSGLWPSTTFNRVLISGYTVTWSPSTSSTTTNVVLCDLSPSKTWTYVLDSGSSTPLTVSADGVAELTIAGAASHTLALTAS